MGRHRNTPTSSGRAPVARERKKAAYPADEAPRLRKRVRALQTSLGKTRAALEEAEARADIAEDEVLATPYRRWVPIEDGGEGRWLPKGERPQEGGTFHVCFADADPETGCLDPYPYTGTVYPNWSDETSELTYDDDCYDVQVYCGWKSRDVRWWSAPTPPPPPLEGKND